MLLYIYNHVIITNTCTTYYISFQESQIFRQGSEINWLDGTNTHPLLVVDQLALSVGTIILVKVFALALSHYSQNPETSSNVVYSFASVPLELIQYNYDLGDSNCAIITPLSLLPDIHTRCPGSNGSRVAICSITKIFLLLAFLIVSSHRQHCTLIWEVAIDFLIWPKLCEVVDSSEDLKKKIHYEVV